MSKRPLIPLFLQVDELEDPIIGDLDSDVRPPTAAGLALIVLLVLVIVVGIVALFPRQASSHQASSTIVLRHLVTTPHERRADTPPTPSPNLPFVTRIACVSEEAMLTFLAHFHKGNEFALTEVAHKTGKNRCALVKILYQTEEYVFCISDAVHELYFVVRVTQLQQIYNFETDSPEPSQTRVYIFDPIETKGA